MKNIAFSIHSIISLYRKANNHILTTRFSEGIKVPKIILLLLSFMTTFSMADPALAVSKGSVLFIMSATRELPLKDGRSYQNAGVYLGEVGEPVRALLDAGYTPVFASPDGVAPIIDPFSEQDFLFKGGSKERAELKALVESQPGFKKPRKLSDIAAEGINQFAGVFVPGGFAPMGDLMTDKNVGKILLAFHEIQRPIAMVCHGPVALIATLPDADAFKTALIANDLPKASELAAGWPFAGYRLTIFSSAEEPLARGPLKGDPLFWVSDAMAQAGANVDRRAQNAINVVEDRELITGQNPFSSDELARVFVERLNAARTDEHSSAAPSSETVNRTALEEANRKLVVDFYRRALLNFEPEAVDQYIGEPYIQHNPDKKNGRAPVKAYITKLQQAAARPASTIENVYVDGDIVVLHVHAKKEANDRGLAVVDIFRVKDGKIVEHWDVLQTIPKTSKNRNGMF